MDGPSIIYGLLTVEDKKRLRKLETERERERKRRTEGIRERRKIMYVLRRERKKNMRIIKSRSLIDY